MAEYDYDYDDERPLRMDPRQGRPLRRRSPAPVTLIMSLLVLAGVAGGAGWMLYRNGVRGPGDGPRPVGAPVTDFRTMAPPQPATQDPTAGLTVYKDDAATAPPTPTFAPPPETLPPPATASAPDGAQAAAAATPPNASAPDKAVALPKPAKPEKAAAARQAGRPGEDVIAALAAAPTRASAKDLGPAMDSGKDSGKDSGTTKGAGATVQIGAFSTKALADQGWDDAAAAAPGPMAGKDRQVVRLEKDGKTLWRTAITGFASRGEAQALCARLRAAGQTCFVR
ncbi:MAG TPA: SPOR domain-containing protein [Caulobacteraceae bacterium]|nr:SPOR domain-containing protein [Caulobacteraceae bacterium]